MIIFLIAIIIVSIISICGLVTKVDTLKTENEVLKKECRTLRNMYFNLKSAKLEDSEWKNMTSAQIAKAILEQKYKEGKLDVEALLNKGEIVEKNNNVLIDALVGGH